MPNAAPEAPRPKVRLIDNWKAEILRLWSMRVAIFWLVVAGLILVWPGLAGEIHPALYAVGGVLMVVSFGVARLLKQPGTDQ
jgi:hypothetical protein